MKTYLFVCLLLVAVASASRVNLKLENDVTFRRLTGRSFLAEEGSEPVGQQQWFTQKLDHSTPTNTASWKQRYFVNDTWYQPGGPVFIFLAGEAPADFFGFQEVQAIKWAAHFNALYISLEHRYYGESLPFTHFTTANMTYLSSQQALADAAYFIDQYNATLSKPGPWVVFGCSYSGALSAWFRAKYPNSVVAAVAPSGPVFAQSNYSSYYGQFASSAADQPGCVEAVEAGVAAIESMLASSDGLAQLNKMFNPCEPITAENAWYFKFTLTEVVGGSDQMDNPPDWPLNHTCAAMTATSDPVANWASLFSSTSCNPFDPHSYAKLVSLTIPNSNRAWLWQKCTEFGFFKTLYPGTSIFFTDVTLDDLTQVCEQAFGIPNMQPDTEWTNTYYGGYDLLATNVMFTNGLKDPWHLLSIIEDVPNSGVQAVTYDLGHCAPMTDTTDEDPPSLKAARAEVLAFLERVLA